MCFIILYVSFVDKVNPKELTPQNKFFIIYYASNKFFSIAKEGSPNNQIGKSYSQFTATFWEDHLTQFVKENI